MRRAVLKCRKALSVILILGVLLSFTAVTAFAETEISSENFNTVTTLAAPYWNVNTASNATVTVDQRGGSGKAIKIVDNNASAYENVFYTYSAWGSTNYNMYASFDYYMESLSGGHYFNLANSAGQDSCFCLAIVPDGSTGKGKLQYYENKNTGVHGAAGWFDAYANYNDYPSSGTAVTGFVPGKWYHFEFGAANSVPKSVIYVDGVAAAEVSYPSNKQFKSINFHTNRTVSYTGDTFYIDNVKLKEKSSDATWLVDDNLDSATLVTSGNDVWRKQNDTATNYAEIADAPVDKVLHIADNSGSARPYADRMIYKTKAATVSFDYYPASMGNLANSGHDFVLFNDTKRIAGFGFVPNLANGVCDGTATLYYYNASGTYTASTGLTDLKLNEWHTISFNANLTAPNNSFDVYVDGVNVQTAYMINARGRDYNKIEFSSHSGATTNEDFYIDNLDISIDTSYGITEVTQNNGAVTANIRPSSAWSGKLIFAAYEDSAYQNFLSAELQDVTLSQGVDNSFSTSALDLATAGVVKVMLWENFRNILPMCQSADISIQ